MKRYLLLLLVAACGSDPPTVEEIYARAIDTTCTRAHECRGEYPGTDPEFQLAYADTLVECIERLTVATERQVEEISTSVELGRVAYDSGDAERCLDELDAMTCEELWTEEDPLSCGTAFLGLVPEGGECDIDLDCATPGAICAGDVCIVPD